MQEQTARDVVDELRTRGVDAQLADMGVYRFGVRVPLGDGREALWGGDGTLGLGAQVLLDGDLVGFMPDPEGSDAFTVAEIVDLIARADYTTPEGHERPSPPPAAPALTVEGGLYRRFLGGFRSRS
jgi:hypothetical protein